MKLSIHRVKISDIGPLCWLMNKFFREAKLEYPVMDEEEVDKQLLDMLPYLNAPDRVYLIAYDGKKPTGFFLGFVGDKPYSKPKRIGMAMEIYVVPEKRNGKAAFKLLQMATRIAIEQGAEGLETVGTYHGTDQRWIHFGFKPHFTYLHMDLERMKRYL
jgi:GNAT superfamily N-acetyltransferase